MHVSLSLTGEVTFFNRYCWEDKPVQLTIGDYPSRSPSQARKRRQQFRRWVTENYNPGRWVFRDRLQKMASKTVEETIDFREKHDGKADRTLRPA
ncbi:Arm DNA-binding domain-containing protein [Pantoea vagans]|uniref:Arm DNA-binding domain-containing protein n=1 Tax=Pantoea vagans TaxID=470934 RepID=UPI003B987102